jgi:hypothetical protein
MTFALTKVRAYGIEAEEPINKRYQQKLILNITAANTDVDLDLGDYSGTFWTAVGATEPGITALKAIKDIQIAADSFVGLGGTSLAGYVQGDSSVPVVQTLNSAASAGGSANETLTVTGLLTTDTVLSAIMITEGANNVAVKTFAGTVAVANQYPVEWTADPGAGAVVKVAFSRATTAVQSGTYQIAMNSTNTQLPDILFLSGNAPTAYVLELSWILKDAQQPIEVAATA